MGNEEIIIKNKKTYDLLLEVIALYTGGDKRTIHGPTEVMWKPIDITEIPLDSRFRTGDDIKQYILEQIDGPWDYLRGYFANAGSKESEMHAMYNFNIQFGNDIASISTILGSMRWQRPRIHIVGSDGLVESLYNSISGNTR